MKMFFSSPWKTYRGFDKFAWVKALGRLRLKRLILSHHKHLNLGDYVIDDRPNNAAWTEFGREAGFKRTMGLRT